MKAIEAYCDKCCKVTLMRIIRTLVYFVIVKCDCGTECKVLKEDCEIIERD